MTIKTKGFIALIPAIIISSLIIMSMFSGSEGVVQYYQTLGAKIMVVQQWLTSEENADRARFYVSF